MWVVCNLYSLALYTEPVYRLKSHHDSNFHGIARHLGATSWGHQRRLFDLRFLLFLVVPFGSKQSYFSWWAVHSADSWMHPILKPVSTLVTVPDGELLESQRILILTGFHFVCVCVHVPQCSCEDWKTTHGSWFSPCIMYLPDMKLQKPGVQQTPLLTEPCQLPIIVFFYHFNHLELYNLVTLNTFPICHHSLYLNFSSFSTKIPYFLETATSPVPSWFFWMWPFLSYKVYITEV